MKILRTQFPDAAANTAATFNVQLGGFKRMRIVGIQCTAVNSDVTASQFRARFGDPTETGHLRMGGPEASASSTIGIQWLVNAPTSPAAGGRDQTGFLPDVWWEKDVTVKLDSTAAAFQLSEIQVVCEVE